MFSAAELWNKTEETMSMVPDPASPDEPYRMVFISAHVVIPAENKWRLIRQYRSDLLARCDWTQLPDAPLTSEQVAAWQAYRQALRDLPEQFSDPDDVVFPSTPE